MLDTAAACCYYDAKSYLRKQRYQWSWDNALLPIAAGIVYSAVVSTYQETAGSFAEPAVSLLVLCRLNLLVQPAFSEGDYLLPLFVKI